MKIYILSIFAILTLLSSLAGCMSSKDRAEELYQKGMSLLDKNPDKAEKAFKDALIMKKNMVKAMYGLALSSERKNERKQVYKYLNLVLEQDPNYIEALIKSGQLLLTDESVDLALIRCNKALDVDKNNIEALNLRAALQLQLNDANGAIEYAKLALLKESANEDANLMLAKERLLNKDEVKAIKYLDNALVVNEKNLSTQIIRTIVLENISKIQEADESYQAIIKLFPDSAFVRKCYVYFLLRHDRTDDVERQLRAIAQSASSQDIQAKLDVVKYVTNTKGAGAGQSELERFVKNEPKNYGLVFVLLNLYRIQNESAKEDALLNETIKKAGKTADGYRARGLVAEKLIHLGNRVEAGRLLNSILKDDTRNAQALILKADMAMQAKDYAGAIADLRTVVSDSPKSSGAALRLATAYERSGLSVLAEEQYKNAYVSGALSSVYGVPYSEFLLRLKQPERSDEVLKQMRNVNIGATIVTENSAQQNQIYTAILSSKNDIDGSLNAYMRANETDSGDAESILAIIRTYMQASKNKEALDFIDNILINDLDNTQVMLLQGQIYASMKDTSKAIQITTDVIKKESKNSLAYQQLARIQLNLNLNTDAEDTVDQGLSFLPDDFELKLIKASVFEASGRYANAIKSYEKMLEERPESIIASDSLAGLLVDYRPDTAGANRAYVLADSFKKNHAPQFLDTYGRICYKVGNLAEAEQALNLLKANEEKYPKNAAIQYHLAKVYLAKSDRINAKKFLEEALSNSKNQQFKQRVEISELLKTL